MKAQLFLKNKKGELGNGVMTSIFGRSANLYEIDLYENVNIPVNYNITDVSEPDKRKTNFTKSVNIPGTKNNSRIFNHIYEISGDSEYNPNKKAEVILMNDGITVLRGNMKLQNIIQYNNNEVEYQIIITGEFTTIFSEIGNKKLNELDFSEYDHEWNSTNIIKSWDNIVRRNETDYLAREIGPEITISAVERETDGGRVIITTSSPHNITEGEWLRIIPDSFYGASWIKGEWQVAETLSAVKLIINHLYPDGLIGFTITGKIRKWTPEGKGYVYPMISWGNESIMLDPINGSETLPVFPVESFTPLFYAKEIWDKIFELSGSKYQSNFLESDFFKRLIVGQRITNVKFPDSNVASREFKVANYDERSVRISGFGAENTGSYNNEWRSFPDNDLQFNPYEFNEDISTSDGVLYNGTIAPRPYDFNINKWVVNEPGKYDLYFSITLKLFTEISDYTASGAFIPPNPATSNYYWGGEEEIYDEDVLVSVKIMKESAGLKTIVNEEVISLVKTGDKLDNPDRVTSTEWEWLEKTINIGFYDKFLFEGDKVWIEVSYYGIYDNDSIGIFTEATPDYNPSGPTLWILTGYRGIIDIKTIGNQFFYNKANPNVIEGTKLPISKFLPKDVLMKDFLISIIRMFNLYIEASNDIENYYIIEPRDDFYSIDETIDWTDKADINSIDITPMGELRSKIYSFEYRKDSDYWNDKYYDETGLVYGNYKKEVENDFLSNEQKISLIFSPSPLINLQNNTDIIVPQIVKKDSNGNNIPTSSSPKILIWGGLRPTSSGAGIQKWVLPTIIPGDDYNPLNDILTYYPYAGHVDSPYDPIEDLNWYYTEFVYWNRARWSNDNLYNKYWKSFIEEISDKDSKLVTINMYLKPTDIYNLDFKKIYVINNNYFRLQKVIDYNAADPQLTKCEFLKLKSPSRFKLQSKAGDDEFDDGGLPPPGYRRPSSVNNFSVEEYTSQFNAKISGSNNIINSNSNSIVISGNENLIGSKSNNISINGDGNLIRGGVKNVSLIGTSNKIIDESDVTYLNGIRYKLGVPISRSGVIDAGLNIAYKKSKNTLTNVMDAAEDEIIQPSSDSYEDVIDAGQNNILNNLALYNVSTENFPRPTTNYLGVQVTESGLTQSLPERIITRTNPTPYSAQ